jgi:hypothetical protein
VEVIQVAALGILSLGWVAGVVVAARQQHGQDASHPGWKPLLGRWRLQTLTSSQPEQTPTRSEARLARHEPAAVPP